MLTPQGRTFTQAVAQELALQRWTGYRPAAHQALQELGRPAPRLGLICGRYEGVDERIRQYLVTDEISIGDYVITGGELAAMIIVDAVSACCRVLGDPEGAQDDSHASGLLEYPHYTRPPEFRGWRVPDVLLSGDHARITRWRREQSLRRTQRRRPDMLAKAPLTDDEKRFLAELDDLPGSLMDQLYFSEELNGDTHETQLRQDLPAGFWFLCGQLDLGYIQPFRACIFYRKNSG